MLFINRKTQAFILFVLLDNALLALIFITFVVPLQQTVSEPKLSQGPKGSVKNGVKLVAKYSVLGF